MTPDLIALQALAWIMSDTPRAERFLAMTGHSADSLRSAIADPSNLAAVINFLENYEPDLIACAEHMGINPMDLVSARHILDGSKNEEGYIC
ncbi:hypothetical protein LPB140_01535 [Sphingorhabdus lutea]|uniref:DUF3572 family protein n=2 Tax=Sphingorhabdus lutea TaxID=1913578 RepID=A0A1L3J9D0_9SPHN|nr:hypothetical protein LPB140_01535 [Sphingorhabdus lutea]